MKHRLRFVALSLFVLCFGLVISDVRAQTITTGSIEGTVFDPNNAAVPGVTVTVTSPQLISPQSSTTNDQGRFKILNLPPGIYTLTVEASKGFDKFQRADVAVNLDKTTSVDIQLSLSGATATVTVTETGGAGLDVTSNTSGTNVSTEQFSNFPTSRTVQGLYTIAPTAARSGLRDASGRDRDPSVGGSSGPENSYILDGVNTADPAFGGSGANLPFEFVQEVEIKTGGYGAENGHSTGGIFNVITKSGGNELHGDGFGYFSTKGLVRKTNEFPFVGAAPNGFSEIDAGIDVGGPIKKDKLWFFGAFNPHQRKNYSLTQTFHQPVNNKITTPFYSGKLTWAANPKNTLTFSTFGDFTKQTGFQFTSTGFSKDLTPWIGEFQTGGQNYVGRLNSTIRSNFTAEVTAGMHFQRVNLIPNTTAGALSLVTDNFAVLRGGSAVDVTNTTIFRNGNPNDLRLAFVDGRGGTVQRGFVRQGWGLLFNQNRNRFEAAARFQTILSKHTLKYGFEFMDNLYKLGPAKYNSGPGRTFADPFGEELVDSDGNPVPAGHKATDMPGGIRVTNNFGVCIVNSGNTSQVLCPSASTQSRMAQIIAGGQGPSGITSAALASLTPAQILAGSPILVLTSVRARSFVLNTQGKYTSTRVESFYLQDDYKFARNWQVNVGGRWDYQQAYGITSTYLKFNHFLDNFQPRLGLVYDFTGKGKGKIFANYAHFLETPIPLDVNVRAGGDEIQIDKNANVNQLNADGNASIIAGSASGLGCLGCTPTPPDFGLKPQTVDETSAGFEYEVRPGFVIGARGLYRAQRNVIEDGSFNDGTTYFLFNPGRRGDQAHPTTEDIACGLPVGCFGHARRYYRALELTATRRFTRNWQLIASYVYSSLTGNYEGLFRNDNGQADPNITSLFDLPELLPNTYGHLPNDRPQQFKADGSYRTPWRVLIGASFRAQSGIPFNELIPHPIYGNNEGFGVQRGTAIVPAVAVVDSAFPNTVNSIGSNRTPFTWNLDVNAYYPIKVGENRELRLSVDWFNVFNVQRAVRLDETFSINSGISGVANTAANRFPNPFYGAGTIFQFPSALRLGVKFTF